MAVQTADDTRTSVLGQWNSAVTSYYLILGASGLLLSLGLIMVLSSSSVDALIASKGASPYGIFLRQAQFALVGLPLAWLASRMPVAFYRRAAWPLLIGAAGLQVLTVLVGEEVNGNKNWLPLGPVQVQPSEAVKLALAVWLGTVLARKRHLLDQWMHVLLPAVVVALAAVGLVLAGGDLGTGIVLLTLVAGAFFVAGVPMRMFALAGVLAAAGVVGLAQLNISRIARIEAFFSDDCDQLGACYQTTRGMYGLASGGLTGRGLGESREKWSYLPEAHNDFIFAILGEELGLLGTGLVLALFAVLAIAVTRLIRRHPDPFVQVATGAIGAWILGQALINIAVVIGLLPVIGVPLPLVSAGGSALITTMIAIGVLVSFARTEPGAKEALSARASMVRRSLAVVGRPSGPDRGERRRAGQVSDD
ncbi:MULTISPECIES: putative lipid II flippase FtsW [unclassified Actinotalea]|uniref:putative lipid II flippase FtsW n=1 Tax=unclassified Actinotalea TaxID=2638618 RepID=UPI0015F52791|nr:MULTISPECIES: putative lipid II flippase FtsW [unclassified Actinotalea]